MKFFTLIHIGAGEQSMHNNSFTKSFDEQINLYFTCARQLHRSLLPEGFSLAVLTNDKAFLERLNSDKYGIEIIQLNFTSHIPSGIKFYSAHFKLEVFDYLASLQDDYIGLVDSDIICVNKIPPAFKTIIDKRLPLYYDITDQVVPAYGAENIMRDKAIISGGTSFGLWAGGEFIAGPPRFFQLLTNEIASVKDAYFQHIASLHHQGDEVLTSIAIENLKVKGEVALLDAGSLSIIGRYWSYVPLHVQKSIDAYANHFLLHLPSDKKFISRLLSYELKGQPFFKKYRRHLMVSRTLEKVFKNIKPYAKRLRKKARLPEVMECL